MLHIQLVAIIGNIPLTAPVPCWVKNHKWTKGILVGKSLCRKPSTEMDVVAQTCKINKNSSSLFRFSHSDTRTLVYIYVFPSIEGCFYINIRSKLMSIRLSPPTVSQHISLK